MVGDELGGWDSGMLVTVKISTGIVSKVSPATLADAGPAMVDIYIFIVWGNWMKGCKHAGQMQCRVSKNKRWVNLGLKLWNPHPSPSLALGVSKSDDFNLVMAACKRFFFSRILREEEKEPLWIIIPDPSTKTLLFIIEVLNLQGQHNYIQGCKYNYYIWIKVKRWTHYTTDLGPLLSQTLSRFLQLSCIFIGQVPSHFHLMPWHQQKFEDVMDAKQIRNAVG